MCFGKTPKIEMPQQPLMPQLPPLPPLQAPAQPKQMFVPAPISASINDFGMGASSSGFKGKSDKKKKTNVQSSKIALKIDPGINTPQGGIN